MIQKKSPRQLFAGAVVCFFMLALILPLSSGSLKCASGGKTITIRATFKYLGPDGKEYPIRWAWCELLDEDPGPDSVIAESYTERDGTVVFTYDSDRGDGLMGGRIDPYVRCTTRLVVLSGDYAHTRARVLKKRRVSVMNIFEAAFYEINTRSWDNNNEDRTVTITDQTDDRYAFFLLDCLAEANMRRPKEGTTSLEPAAMALQGDICTGEVNVIYPSLLPTGFQSGPNEIWIESEYKDDFDTIVHEYGHHEMWEAYGHTLAGDYGRTQGDHVFNAPVTDGLLSADARWTAFAEAWADFCPVIVKGFPKYRDFDIEADDMTNSDRCEGTICRIFWDLWDTHRDSKLDRDKKPLARVLDDDPFGFCSLGFYPSLPGREALKSILRNKHPRSLGALRSTWNERYANNPLVRRAFESVLWRHGIRDGIEDSPPSCSLSVEGRKENDTFFGSLTLRASVEDADITPETPLDGRLMHVRFYWCEYSSRAKALQSDSEDDWHFIGFDIDGSDGYSCSWPAGKNRPGENNPVCIVAVASDHFARSDFKMRKSEFTAAQVGPIYIKDEDRETGTGGGAAGTGGGFLTEIGHYRPGGFLGKKLKVVGKTLYLTHHSLGLDIVDVSDPSLPILRAVYRAPDALSTDFCESVDVIERQDTANRPRHYALVGYAHAGLRVVDVTKPEQPKEVGVLKDLMDRFGRKSRLYAKSVKASGKYAYVWYSSHLSVIDLSDVHQPREVSYWSPWNLPDFSIWDTVVLGDKAYFAGMKYGLTILPLEEVRERRFKRFFNPSYDGRVYPETLLCGRFQTAGLAQVLCLFRNPGIENMYAIVSDTYGEKGQNRTLRIVDVTDPDHLTEMGAFDVDMQVNDIDVQGKYAFISGSRGILVLDVSDPSSPVQHYFHRGPSVYKANALDISGDHVYVIVGSMVYVLKISQDN